MNSTEVSNKRRKKLKLNLVASLSSEISALVASLVLPRLLLIYFGSGTNGLVSSIAQFLSFISVCELGIGAVVKANLYSPLANKDDFEISRIMKSAQKFFRLIAFILIVYSLCLAVLLPLRTKEFDYFFTASLVMIIAVSSFAQYYFGITNQLLLTADQSAYIHLFVGSAIVLTNTLVCAILMKLGAGIHVVKLATAFLYIIKPMILLVYVRKHYNIDKNITITTEPIKQKWNGLAQHLATIVQDNTDVIVLTLFSSLENVSIYSVYILVINGIRQIMNIANNSIGPLLGELIVKRETETLNRTFSWYEWIMHTVATVLFTITGVMIIPFIKIYTAGVEDANYIVPSFALLITCAGFFRCVEWIYNIVVHSAGHFKETQVAAIIEPIINITISILFVWKFGLVGVAIGTVTALIYRCIYLVFYLSRHILNRKWIFFVKNIVVDIITAFLSIVAARMINVKYGNYFEWILFAAIVGIVVIVISSLVNYVCYKENMRVLLRKIMSRKK